jgi:hypothetical protein
MWSNIINQSSETKEQRERIDGPVYWDRAMNGGNKMITEEQIEDVKQDEFSVVVGEGKREFVKPRIPNNLYPARCVDVSMISPGEFGERVAIRFELIHESLPVTLSVIGYKNISKTSKLGKLFTTWLGSKLEAGKSFDLKSIVGQRAVLFVKDYTNSKNETFSVIQDVLPFNVEERK